MMKAQGAYPTSGVAEGYCLKREAASVYLSLEAAGHSDLESLERVLKNLTWRPQSVILLTVGRDQGSLLLAFEVAASITDRWVAFIDFGGLTQWERRFQLWQQTRRDRPS
jgi:hypothetical protein